MSNTTPRTRIRIVIDDADHPFNPTAPYQLNVYPRLPPDGTQNRYPPTNPGGRAIIGDNIPPNMLTALAAAWQADPIEEDGEEP